MREQVEHAVEAPLHVKDFQDFLLLLGLDVQEAGHQVGELSRVVDLLQDAGELRHGLGQQRDGLQGPLLQDEGAGLQGCGVRRGFRDQIEAGRHEGQALQVIEHPKALFTLTDHMLGAIPGGEVADHPGDGAHGIQVSARRFPEGRIPLQYQPDAPAAAGRLLSSRKRDAPADGQRDHGTREHHRVADRQNDQHVFGDLLHRGRGIRSRIGYCLAHTCSHRPGAVAPEREMRPGAGISMCHRGGARVSVRRYALRRRRLPVMALRSISSSSTRPRSAWIWALAAASSVLSVFLWRISAFRVFLAWAYWRRYAAT